MAAREADAGFHGEGGRRRARLGDRGVALAVEKSTANCGSMAVWLGLVVGPVTLSIVNRPNSRDLSERL